LEVKVAVNQNIKEELVTLTEFVTIWYNNVRDELEECYKPFNKINLLVF
jgi:hypothetical protein